MKSLLKNKVVRRISLVSILLVLFTGTVVAEYGPQNYDLVVGKFNGSACTGKLTVMENEDDPWLEIDFVGGGYSLDVQEQNGRWGGAWEKDVTTGFRGYIPPAGVPLKGDRVNLRFSNKLTTKVDVRTYGQWKSY